MPRRKQLIITGDIYHVFNKMLSPYSFFKNEKGAAHFINLAQYYRSNAAYLRYSMLNNLEKTRRKQIMAAVLNPTTFKVKILAYIIMPTHFHFLIRQSSDKGLSKFIGDISNAFTHHINLKSDRKGPLFFPSFKAVLIKSEEQLLHVSRYIHLNPFSASLVTNLQNLVDYPWSSYPEYLNAKAAQLSNSDLVLSHFNGPLAYQTFVENHAEHQKMLELAKYAIKWE